MTHTGQSPIINVLLLYQMAQNAVLPFSLSARLASDDVIMSVIFLAAEPVVTSYTVGVAWVNRKRGLSSITKQRRV